MAEHTTRKNRRGHRIVYKIAFQHGPFGENADIQERKIIEAKRRVGLRIGRNKSRAK